MLLNHSFHLVIWMNRLCSLTFDFPKVVRQHISGALIDLIPSLSALQLRMRSERITNILRHSVVMNFGNRSRYILRSIRCSTETDRSTVPSEDVRLPGFFGGKSVSLECITGQSQRPRADFRHFQASTEDLLLHVILDVLACSAH